MFRKRFGGSSSSMRRGGFGGGASRRPFARRGPPRRRFFDVSQYINKPRPEELVVPEYVAKHTFADFEINTKLKDNIITKGFTVPTPIQDQIIPHILQGSDVVGIANTGTGKTAAFLIPLVEKVLRDPKEHVLVVVPTRELAIQVQDELDYMISGTGMRSVACVGGESLGRQVAMFRRGGISFVIGTPGRLKDLLERRVMSLASCRAVVLDEADRMLDMGFIGPMRELMAMMPKDRQTLFFSATMSREIEGLIHEFLNNPVKISVKTGDTAKTIEQDVVHVGHGKPKINVLVDLLHQPEFAKVLVFGTMKHSVERLAQDLIAHGIKADSIHGNKRQSQRQRALDAFKQGRTQVLVATDVAARGIDVSDVSHVINYDLPATYEDYVHRIGRTGRAGKRGKALTFVE